MGGERIQKQEVDLSAGWSMENTNTSPTTGSRGVVCVTDQDEIPGVQKTCAWYSVLQRLVVCNRKQEGTENTVIAWPSVPSDMLSGPQLSECAMKEEPSFLVESQLALYMPTMVPMHRLVCC